jgi:hypothetical protein
MTYAKLLKKPQNYTLSDKKSIHFVAKQTKKNTYITVKKTLLQDEILQKDTILTPSDSEYFSVAHPNFSFPPCVPYVLSISSLP